MRFYQLCSGILLVLLTTGCGLLPEQIDETKDWSANKFYSEAKAALTEGDYETAIKHFETLQARYPYGRYAQQAQMEIVYAYYKYDEPESAIAAADRFIRLHPRHPHVDYVYYLKGLVNFERERGLVDRYLPQDPTQRDPGAARQSFLDFADFFQNQRMLRRQHDICRAENSIRPGGKYGDHRIIILAPEINLAA